MCSFFPAEPIVVAHRGAAHYAPENTLAAYRNAVRLGYRYAETDVGLTKDGYWICLHDDRVDRTSNGQGLARDMTLRELRKLDFGGWFAQSFADERVPLLDELLQLCNESKMRLLVEIKDRILSVQELQGLVNKIYEHRMEEQIAFISFHWQHLDRIRSLDEKFWLGYLATEMSNERFQSIKATNRFFIDVHRFPNGEPIGLAQRTSVPIVVWTVNGKDVLAQMLMKGIGIITTDKLLPGDLA